MTSAPDPQRAAHAVAAAAVQDGAAASDTELPRPVEVLWRDEYGAVVCKPSGMLSHNSTFAGPREYALLQAARDTLGARVWLVNRLDRGTSGCILVCFDGAHVSKWSEALQAGEKRYLAVVRGRLRAGTVIDRALKDENGVKREARTAITPLAISTLERVSLVQCDLDHGRNHQARRHLNRANHPVVNDSNHGDTRFNAGFRNAWGVRRLLLHAESLRLAHPFSQEQLEIRCPPTATMQPVITQLMPEWVDRRQQRPASTSACAANQPVASQVDHEEGERSD